MSESNVVNLAVQYGAQVEYCPIDGNPLVVCVVYGHNKTIESSSVGRTIGKDQHPNDANPAYDFLKRNGKLPDEPRYVTGYFGYIDGDNRERVSKTHIVRNQPSKTPICGAAVRGKFHFIASGVRREYTACNNCLSKGLPDG